MWKYDVINEAWEQINQSPNPLFSPAPRVNPAMWINKDGNVVIYGGCDFQNGKIRQVFSDMWIYAGAWTQPAAPEAPLNYSGWF